MLTTVFAAISPHRADGGVLLEKPPDSSECSKDVWLTG